MVDIIISFIFLLFTAKPVEPLVAQNSQVMLAERNISLEKRYNDEFVNEVFKDNILLVLKYASGQVSNKGDVDWEKVVKPFEYEMVLKPGEVFAFHDDVLPEYSGKVKKTTNTHFNASEGYKFSGALWGDGVCHLASLIYWAAKDAGLDAVAPVRHDFANIPEVPREYGVSIYATPGENSSDQMQNLYITNNRNEDVVFEFTYDGGNLKVAVKENANRNIAVNLPI